MECGRRGEPSLPRSSWRWWSTPKASSELNWTTNWFQAPAALRPAEVQRSSRGTDALGRGRRRGRNAGRFLHLGRGRIGRCRPERIAIGEPRCDGCFLDGRLGLGLGLDGRLAFAGVLTVAARTDFAAGERWVFASASAGGRRATETSNGKMCARMRFISSIGFRLRPGTRSGRPPSRGAATKTAL